MSAYAQHLATLTQRLDRLLPQCGFDHLLIPAGVEKYNFLDDTHAPFKVNPHFKAWLPLTQASLKPKALASCLRWKRSTPSTSCAWVSR